MRPSYWLATCALALGGLWAATAHAGTAREQEAFADQAIGFMKTGAQTVRGRLGRARATQDLAQSSCLNEHLTQLEAVQREAEDARAALRRASLREDVDAIQTASAAMTRLDARAKEVQREIAGCPSGGESLAVRDDRLTAGEVRPGPVETLVALERAESADVTVTASTGASTSAGFFGAPAAAPAAPAAGAPAATPSSSPYAGDATHEAAMLAYSADLTLAVFQVDQGLAAVEGVARDLGGYLAQRGDAQVSIRVPRPKFDQAMARIEKLGDVLHRNVAAEDVTDEYVDLDLRLANARAMRDQLAGLLRGAAVKDAVEIEKELAKVTEVIEQIEGRLKVLRDKVGYSSITVSFQANAPSPVRSTAILPFPWLDTMGLHSLLDVPKVSP